jgi:hypothetical protein
VVFWADLIADNWSYLDECVRRGDTAWAVTEGMEPGLRFAREPEGEAIFHGAMAAGNGVDAHLPIVDAYDFSGAEVIADLGGGGGGLLGAILLAHPNARGVLVDLAGALGGAAERLEAEGVGDRCDLVEHDLRQSVPVDADIYVLKHVLHAGGEHEPLTILDNVRGRIRPESKLLVIEVGLPDEVASPSVDAEHAALLDLTMLVVTGGRERTRSEWTEFLASGGFEVTRVVPVEGMALEPLVIFEAVPI